MTSVEKMLVEALRRAEQAESVVRLLRQTLVAVGKCTHSRVREFEWEHDSGYGKQSRHKGVRCELCGKENRWGSDLRINS